MSINSFKSTHNLKKINYVILAAALLLIFYALSRTIVPSKGLDFSDEGHYLLSADPADYTDAWGWPYGWNLQLLYRISGYSISSYRTYGFILLLLASYRFSKKLYQSLKIVNPMLFAKSEQIIIQVLVITSTLLFYAGFLRSPSYNWLNLLGLNVFLAGTLGLLSNLHQPGSKKKEVLICKFEIALGLFIALPAKPSTLGFGLVSLFISIFILKRCMSALQIVFQVTAIVVFFVLLSILTNFWPPTILEQTLQVLKMPPLVPNHSFLGAIQDLGTTPIKLVKAFSTFPETAIIFLVLLFGVLFHYAKITVFERQRIFLILFYFTIFVLSFHFFIMENSNKVTNLDFNWFQNPLISKSLILLITIFIFFNLIKMKQIIKIRNLLIPNITFSMLIYFNLVVALISLGFGSSSGIFDKLALGPNLLTAILVTQIIASIKNSVSRLIFLFGLNFFILFIVSVVFIGSYNNPYRSEDLSKMTYSTVVGNHNTSILLDQNNASRITKMRNAAKQSGFLPSTPTINLVYPSEVGIGYALGGRQSPTIHFIWFGYPESLSQSKYLFSKSEGRFNFRKSWILKSPEKQYKSDISIVQQLIQVIQVKTQKKFPTEYILVYQDNTLELWKPVFD